MFWPILKIDANVSRLNDIVYNICLKGASAKRYRPLSGRAMGEEILQLNISCIYKLHIAEVDWNKVIPAVIRHNHIRKYTTCCCH